MRNLSKLAHDIISDCRYVNYVSYITKKVTKGQAGEFKVKDLNEEIERIFPIRQKRNEYKEFCKLTFRQVLWAKYQGKADKIAKFLPDMSYSMGQFNNFYVNKTSLNGFFSNATEYSKSCKYKATHGSIDLRLTSKEFLSTEVIAGVITIYGKKIGKDLFKCQWIEGKGIKQNTHCVKVDGYIYRDYHFTAANDKEAIEVARQRKQRLIELELRAKNEQKLRQLCETLPLNRIFVEVNDSLNSGNCLIGTQSFASAIGIDLSVTGAVRADFIYEKRNGREGFVLKAINQAKMRYITKNLI